MVKLIALVPLLALAQGTVAQAPTWGQCGGIGWSGPTTCTTDCTCVYLNDYHSQCLPNYTPMPPTPPNPEGLNVRMVAKGKKYFGSTLDYSNTYTHAATILMSEFGQATPLNAMEDWFVIESSLGHFNWGLADILVNWAASNGQLIRGSLISQSLIPSWLSPISDAADLTAALTNHISNVVGRYKGKIYGLSFYPPVSVKRANVSTAWDVVKEILNEDGSYRSNIFYNVIGEKFVKIAFQAARAADPNAKLYINDFNLDSNNAKVQGIIRVINKVNSGKTRLIDGIGSQVNLGAGQAGGVQAALTTLAKTGLEVAITELDIAGASPDDYSTVVKACLAVPKCIGITTSGVADTDPGSPHLLFDSNYQPTPAYSAVLDTLA